MVLELLFNFKHSREFCDLNSFLCSCVKLHGLRVTKTSNSTGPRFFDNTFVVGSRFKNSSSVSTTFQLCGKFMTFMTWNRSFFEVSRPRCVFKLQEEVDSVKNTTINI